MKGLQGERLRQAFKYLDADQDGFIRPDQFKQIILVSFEQHGLKLSLEYWLVGNSRSQAFRCSSGQATDTVYSYPGRTDNIF